MSVYFVYMLAGRRNGTLYIGVTSDLVRRMGEHKALAVPGFTRKYRVIDLVYFETYSEINEAIAREKQLKGWNRAWKIKLIEAGNPGWNDLEPW
ncbi:GIY-YIG nuclease family protein [Salinarimonas sp.]|uniref:GIY-YIG nuclease family protein n=1 Tax=Salinarimonas sp. TaxID=2766526 RepID=UPI00391AB652